MDIGLVRIVFFPAMTASPGSAAMAYEADPSYRNLPGWRTVRHRRADHRRTSFEGFGPTGSHRKSRRGERYRRHQMLAAAAPDGYTIGMIQAGLAINPSLYDQVPYDPIKDFEHITQAIAVPNVLVVHPSFDVKSVAELVSAAKARPRKSPSPPRAWVLRPSLFRAAAN